MRILNIVQGYSPAVGGTEWLVQRLSEELVRQFGDEVTVFTTNCYGGDGFYNPGLPVLPDGWTRVNGIDIRRFPVARRLGRAVRALQYGLRRAHLPVHERLRFYADGPIVPGLREAIRRQPADLIFASSFPLMHMFVALDAAHQSRRPCVLHGALHPEDAWSFQRPMIYAAIRRAESYIANTGFEEQYLVEEKNIDARQITTIGLGVNPEPFLGISPSDAREKLGLAGYPLVGFIGQIVPHKGVDTLMRAMPQVWEKVPEARLLVAGARRPFAGQVERLLASYSPEDQAKVVFRYDFKDAEKPWLYAALDVFAYPSGFESFGVAFLEAWSCAKPVVSCRRGAIPWVVEDGKDGLLVEYQDHTMLAEAIISLLSNPDLARSLGSRGHQKTLSQFTWPVVAQKYRRVFQKVLDQSR